MLDWTPEQGSDVGGLFDAAGDANHPHRDSIARVRNLLMEAAGGELQSPFYVAIGAALAAAYRIERDQDGVYCGGMALAVFDEAFPKRPYRRRVHQARGPPSTGRGQSGG